MTFLSSRCSKEEETKVNSRPADASVGGSLAAWPHARTEESLPHVAHAASQPQSGSKHNTASEASARGQRSAAASAMLQRLTAPRQPAAVTQRSITLDDIRNPHAPLNTGPRKWTLAELQSYGRSVQQHYQRERRPMQHVRVHLRLPDADPSDMPPGALDNALREIGSGLPAGWAVVGSTVRRGSLILQVELAYCPGEQCTAAVQATSEQVGLSCQQQQAAGDGAPEGGTADNAADDMAGPELVAHVLEQLTACKLACCLGVQRSSAVLGAQLSLEVEGGASFTAVWQDVEGYWQLQQPDCTTAEEAVAPPADSSPSRGIDSLMAGPVGRHAARLAVMPATAVMGFPARSAQLFLRVLRLWQGPAPGARRVQPHPGPPAMTTQLFLPVFAHMLMLLMAVSAAIRASLHGSLASEWPTLALWALPYLLLPVTPPHRLEQWAAFSTLTRCTNYYLIYAGVVAAPGTMFSAYLPLHMDFIFEGFWFPALESMRLSYAVVVKLLQVPLCCATYAAAGVAHPGLRTCLVHGTSLLVTAAPGLWSRHKSWTHKKAK
eukprot:CAMPEP_0202909404 /NCGR_PEP_ID=MMETSP1392-20130828/49226_1 /ASSEMBLY_ACC=CAM_ASM_000868 /TAXON_ID=225041 /ORGANISM="Chlamydomonas chlamydogama, Strain SAG 11-48b" /LENGTH=549 /DNA_ID=CAMNT_0049599141 /DNA_START=662 /DNA_END=2311 /DNA_ORIENTATION=-